LFETFSPRCDIALGVDKHGAHADFTQWYPYSQAEIFDQGNINIIEQVPDPVGLLVGGGSLSLGYAAGIALIARSRRVPAALAGVDVWQPDSDPHSPQREALIRWLDLFDQIIPRTRRSLLGLQSIGLNPLYGADWALRLPTDAATNVTMDPRRALVILREGLAGPAGEAYAAWTDRLMEQLAAQGYRPSLMPFCPEDERFLNKSGLYARHDVERGWWNARRLKQLIAMSGLTVTVGRLHPMIFAAPTDCNLAALRPIHWVNEHAGSMEKLTDMAEDLGIRVFDTAEAFTEELAAGRIGPAGRKKVKAALRRTDAALDRLHTLFRP
jgi:hypothetical protein